MMYAITTLIIFVICFTLSSGFFLRFLKGRAKVVPGKSVVLITGCDSGFGELTSKSLSERGFLVVSACLSKEGADRIGPHVAKSIVCDVTKEAEVAAMARELEGFISSEGDSGLRLWAVVNNAGIAPMGFVDWMPMEAFRAVMDVNYFGLVAVTKAVLPLLKRTRGSRVINVSSMAGYLAGPGFGPYSASKHAVEGFAKCLRQELRPWGISVCNINPAFMRTPLIAGSISGAVRYFSQAPDEIREQYEEGVMNNDTKTILAVTEDPMKVVRAIGRAVTDKDPSFSYFVGLQAAVLRVLMILPREVLELLTRLFGNDCGPRKDALAKIQG